MHKEGDLALWRSFLGVSPKSGGTLGNSKALCGFMDITPVQMQKPTEHDVGFDRLCGCSVLMVNFLVVGSELGNGSMNDNYHFDGGRAT